MAAIDRKTYAYLYGPTVGDRVRLGGTSLFIEVEKDLQVHGEELVAGLDKYRPSPTRAASDCADTVISNVVVMDHTGFVKADVAITEGCIAGVGKAGNPATMDGVTPGMAVGPTTQLVDGSGKLLTPGAVDSMSRLLSSDQASEAALAGTTTVISDGTGFPLGQPHVLPYPVHSWTTVRTILQEIDHWPINVALLGQASGCATAQPLKDQVTAGMAGLCLFPDARVSPDVLAACLDVLDQEDVPGVLYGDPANESCFVEETLGAIAGRSVIADSGSLLGGHFPDQLVVAAQPNVLPASTTVGRPSTLNPVSWSAALSEFPRVALAGYRLSDRCGEETALAEDLVVPEIMTAADLLHDLGAISIFGSAGPALAAPDSLTRTVWAVASAMSDRNGPLPGDRADSQNIRVKRYLAKYTINPAVAYGISHLVGSVERGKRADLVLWDPAQFGEEPDLVMIGGAFASGRTDPFPGRPLAAARGIRFVSRSGRPAVAELGLQALVEAVRDVRGLGKTDMAHNTALPDIKVDPQTHRVSVDGMVLGFDPTETTSGPPAGLPGEVITAPGRIVINVLGRTARITVLNTDSRPVSVGSHLEFCQANKALQFDRDAVAGMRLDIPSGRFVRFDPGREYDVTLVALGGTDGATGSHGIHPADEKRTLEPWVGLPPSAPALAAADLSAPPGPAALPAADLTPREHWGDRTLADLTFVATHNSDVNKATQAEAGRGWSGWFGPLYQAGSVRAQLDQGVRALLIDVGVTGTEVLSCHGDCTKSPFRSAVRKSGGLYRQFGDVLKPVKEFLEAWPNEIVSLLLEDYTRGDTPPDDDPDGRTAILRHELAAAGLATYLFVPNADTWSVATRGWPAAARMVEEGKRLVVFTNRGYGDRPDIVPGERRLRQNGLLYDQGWAVETHFEWDGQASTVRPRRRNRPLTWRPPGFSPLVILNHIRGGRWLTYLVESDAEQDNGPKLWKRTGSCQEATRAPASPVPGLKPNYLVVDFSDRPSGACTPRLIAERLTRMTAAQSDRPEDQMNDHFPFGGVRYSRVHG
ncbi:urease subunit beta [Kitasatospora sp. NPDC101447]|uniref:urease subunit beta n=1 Tax=Kitasatospora sp. NPDC101447 TaxID=3364102 RepID=UPI00381DF852